MESTLIAYVLIGAVLVGYAINLWRRREAAERERARLQAATSETKM